MVILNPKVDKYMIDGCMRCKFGATPQCKVNNWREELDALRQIVLESELVEDLKWGVPCYTLNNKNVLLVSAFKEFACISFFKGVLLNDPHNLLEKPGENSQSTRFLKFTNFNNIIENKDLIKDFILQSIEFEKNGLKVELKKETEPLPEELIEKFKEMPELESAFFTLTRGKQRGYIIYFSQPKQTQSKINRIDKCVDKILKGEGLNDKYKC